MISSHKAICVIGAGPRGLSVLERLCANERAGGAHSAVTVHMVDPCEPGAGAVWRPDQSRHLLMNTVASQITAFTDHSCSIEGPIEPGPSLYEWAAGLTGPGAETSDDATPCAFDDQTLAEARALGPDTYPTRALYGTYLSAMFQRVVSRAPRHVTVEVHRTRAVALTDGPSNPGGQGRRTGQGMPRTVLDPTDLKGLDDLDDLSDLPQSVWLEDGSWLCDLDAVVLAQGHVPVRPLPREQLTAHLARIHGLTYISPASPADLDLSGIRPGEPVLLRGLGLSFFDFMVLLTAGRGGTFVREDREDGAGREGGEAREGAEGAGEGEGRLVYRPSGQEPKLYATSRRGIPYHARGKNEKGVSERHQPRLLTPELIDELRERTEKGEPVRFLEELWPLIAAEVESVYYATWLRARGLDTGRPEFAERYVTAADATGRQALLDEYGIDPAERWDWERLSRPYAGREFADREEFRAWLLEYLARDVEEADAGNVSGPLKAALDVLRDLRNEIRLVVDHSGLEGGSYRDELSGWYTPLNAYLSIGPPASRIEEMIALIEAGVLELTGPGTEIRVDTGEGPEDGTDSGQILGTPPGTAPATAAGTGSAAGTATAAGDGLGSGDRRGSGAAAGTGGGPGSGPGTGAGPRAGDGRRRPAFVARSSTVPGPPIRCTALIEARLHEPDLRRAADPLLLQMLSTGQASLYRIPEADGTSYETGGLAVTGRPYRIVDARGHAHPRRFAYGVPTESVHWVTAAGTRPGVDSVTTGDSDAIARAVLDLPPRTGALAGSPTVSLGVIV